MSLPARSAERTTPQCGAAPGATQVREQRRRLRLGGRRLDAAASLPRPRLGGRQLLRGRVEAHPRERAGRRALPRGRRPAHGGEIVAISEAGRAPKNDPAIFALAMAPARGDEATRKAALDALPRVCRTGDAPVPVRDVRRGLPRLGPLAAARGRRLVRGAAGRRARLPGGQVPPARRHDAPRPAAARAPGGPRQRGNPTLELARRARAGCSSGSPAAARRTACRGSSRASRSPRRRRRRRESAELIREYGLPREALPSEHLDLARGLGGAARRTCR